MVAYLAYDLIKLALRLITNKPPTGSKMNKLGTVVLAISAATLLAACSNTPKLASQPMPKSGFLPNYSVLVPIATSEADTRIWRYRKAGVNPGTYTAVILDPIYLNQNATKEISPEAINQAKLALQDSMVSAINSRGSIKIVNQPGPGVARISVGMQRVLLTVYSRGISRPLV
jgi:hypothetical protein